MAFYPFEPAPSSVHPPVVIDPALHASTDQGYMFRRSQFSRPRRIFQLDYLGKISHDMRFIRDFLQEHRLSVTPFQWLNFNTRDTATVASTTPVILTFQGHGYVTGQWVAVNMTPTAGPLDGFYQVTRLNYQQVSLNGSVASGAGSAIVTPYVPLMIGHYPEGTFPSAEKLMGPDSLDSARGRFTWTIFLEEIL